MAWPSSALLELAVQRTQLCLNPRLCFAASLSIRVCRHAAGACRSKGPLTGGRNINIINVLIPSSSVQLRLTALPRSELCPLPEGMLPASCVRGKQLFNTNAQPESSIRRSVSPKGSRQRTSSHKLRLPIAKDSRMCIR